MDYSINELEMGMRMEKSEKVNVGNTKETQYIKMCNKNWTEN